MIDIDSVRGAWRLSVSTFFKGVSQLLGYKRKRSRSVVSCLCSVWKNQSGPSQNLHQHLGKNETQKIKVKWKVVFEKFVHNPAFFLLLVSYLFSYLISFHENTFSHIAGFYQNTSSTKGTIQPGLRLVPSGNFFLALNRSHHFLFKKVRIW